MYLASAVSLQPDVKKATYSAEVSEAGVPCEDVRIPSCLSQAEDIIVSRDNSGGSPHSSPSSSLPVNSLSV